MNSLPNKKSIPKFRVGFYCIYEFHVTAIAMLK